MQQREYGHRQTHCEKSRHVQHFAPSFQATFQRKSSTRDELKHDNQKGAGRLERSWHVVSDTEFASGWSWYRAYFSSSSKLHAKILINQRFSNFWQTGSSLTIKYISCLLWVDSNYLNNVNYYLTICIKRCLFISASMLSIPTTSTYETRPAKFDIISVPLFVLEFLIFGFKPLSTWLVKVVNS